MGIGRRIDPAENEAPPKPAKASNGTFAQKMSKFILIKERSKNGIV